MGNAFEREVDLMKRGLATGAPRDTPMSNAIESLEHEIRASRDAADARVVCRVEGGALSISLAGQPIGSWRMEGSSLVLYRPDSSSPDSHATTVAEAAKMTARLVAAAGQA